MATEWISPTWRMPEESNQSKFENYSLDFDGTQDIDCGNNSVFNNTFTGNAFSFSVWVKSSSNVAYDGILNFSSRVQSFLNSNKIKIWLQGSSGYIVTAFTSNTTILSDTWYHIVFTKNGNDNTLYINGVSDNTVTSTGNVASTTGNFRIGSYNGSQYFWDGNLTEVSIFDYSLTDGTGGTQDQITALYNLGTPVNPMVLTPLPVAYYPLGSGSTGSASTLTVPNSSVPSATVFNFTGSSEHVLLPQLNTTGAYTISCWVKSTGANYQMIYNEDEALRTPSGSDRNFFWTIAFGKIRWANWFTSGYQQVESSNTINDGEWHHTLGVWDGTTNTGSIKVFIDGILRGTATAGATTRENHTMANNSSIIGGQNSSYDFDGEMANFQVWTTGLSYGSASSSGDTAGGDVATIYNNGVPLYTGTQPESSSLKFWNKLNVDTSTWDGSDWEIGNSTANYTTALNFPGGTDYIDFGTGFPTTLGASATAATASGWVKINDLTQKQALFNITTAGGNYFGSFI